MPAFFREGVWEYISVAKVPIKGSVSVNSILLYRARNESWYETFPSELQSGVHCGGT